MEKIRLLASVVVITVTVLPIPASAWNIPGHMLSAAIAYQILQQENPPTIEKVKDHREGKSGAPLQPCRASVIAMK
jgi:hypothetical protein